jgi:hypothetical protein
MSEKWAFLLDSEAANAEFLVGKPERFNSEVWLNTWLQKHGFDLAKPLARFRDEMRGCDVFVQRDEMDERSPHIMRIP